MKRKFNLKMLCRRYSDGGATPPAADPASTVTPPASDPAVLPATDPKPDGDAKSTPTAPTLTQADVDKAVSDAIEKFKAEQANAKDYDKMTAEQKVAYLEQAAKDRALQDFTANHLSEIKLPKEFASFLKGTDEEDTKKRAADFKTAYDAAVQAGVEARFKESGYEPGKTSGAGSSSLMGADTLAGAVSAALNLK